MFLGLIAAVLIVVTIIIYRRGGLKYSFANTLGAAKSSSNAKWLAVMALVAITAGLIIWQWSALVALHSSVMGPNFPMWGYAVGIALIAVALHAKITKGSFLEFPFGKIMTLVAIFFLGWYVYDEVNDNCPTKQAYISVPAQGMVVDLQTCWDEEFVQLDLREVGVTNLSFNAPAKVLEGRTIREFARIVTGTPGLAHGHAHLRFNSREMRKYGMTTLPVFVGPSNIQPGAQARFSDADIQALSQ